MWNICRAQCPTYWVDKDIFGVHKQSSIYKPASTVVPIVAQAPVAIKPVTTLSPAFWLESNNSSGQLDSKSSPKPSSNGFTLNGGNNIVYEQPKPQLRQLHQQHNQDSIVLGDDGPSNNQQPQPKSSLKSNQIQVELSSEQAVSAPVESITNVAADSKMDPKNMTEYKRSFVWGRPMVDVPPPKPEPRISQYQISYGGDGHGAVAAAPPTAPLQPKAPSNHSSDKLDHSISVSSNESRSPTPGYVIKENEHLIRVEANLTRASPALGIQVSQGLQQQQQHQHPEQIGHGPSELFSYERAPRPPSPLDLSKQSEYNAKFKPFDDYVYVENEGKFKKQTNATKMATAGASRGETTSASKAWFVEVEERCKQACKYRARSQNGDTPINPEHPWNGVTIKDRNLQALALATQMICEEKKQERKTRSSSARPTSRSSQARLHLNSAPASLRDRSLDITAKQPQAKPAARKVPGKASPVTTNTTTDKNNNVGPAKPPIVPKKAPTLKASPKSDSSDSAPKEKVWIKPKKKQQPEPPQTKPEAKAVPKKVVKPEQKTAPAAAAPEPIKFDPEPKSVPLRTTEVKSPEELTGIKSPSPESWKVSIEKGGLNWVNGNTPVNFDGSKVNSAGQTGGQSLVKPVPINGSVH